MGLQRSPLHTAPTTPTPRGVLAGDGGLGSHPEDWRYGLRPKHPEPNPTFVAQPYHQVYRDRFGFVPDLSILDLLFDMGPEALLILRDSYVCPTIP